MGMKPVIKLLFNFVISFLVAVVVPVLCWGLASVALIILLRQCVC